MIHALQDISKDLFIEDMEDIIVDFSFADVILNYAHFLPQDTKFISAILHYNSQHLKFIDQLKRTKIILYFPNLTLEINFLLVALKALTDIAFHADVEVIEEHFRDKIKISGTALRIASALGFDKYEYVNSIRVGGIVGKHEVVFGFSKQMVRLVHESINRKVFGQGFIFSPNWSHFSHRFH